MKVLIWIGWLFVASAVSTFFKMNGVLLGGIPTVVLYLFTISGARFSCQKYDEHLEIKKINKQKINSQNEDNVENSKKYLESKMSVSAEMIFCRKCGAKMPADSLFCSRCGEKIIRL